MLYKAIFKNPNLQMVLFQEKPLELFYDLHL